MPLIDKNKMPPGGFFYREVGLNWKTPNPYLPIQMIAAELQIARIQNPGAGLNPKLDACLKAVEDYTCARLHNSAEWCIQENAMIEARLRTERTQKNCKGCGSKKRSK